MARNAKLDLDPLKDVRIPCDIHRCLDTFLGDLKLRILEAAVRKAAVRATDSDSPIVSADVLVRELAEFCLR